MPLFLDQRYDSVADKFTTLPQMPAARILFGLTKHMGGVQVHKLNTSTGIIYAMAGHVNPGTVVYQFSPATLAWTTATNMISNDGPAFAFSLHG